jgi:SAM-dependent methyltransferase
MSPGIEAQRAYYDRRWAETREMNPLERERADAILSLVRRAGVPLPRILDLGCGRGQLTALLAGLGPATGIDLSKTAVAAARERWPDVRWIAGDLFAADLPAAGFDVVVSQEVLEHVEDQPRYLDVAANALRPMGFLVLTTPNRWVQERRSRAEHEAWGLQPIENWVDRPGLRSLLEPRFRVLELKTIIPGFGSRGWLAVANSPRLRRLLGRLGAGRPYDALRLRLGMGLHLVALAQRR